MRRCLVLLVSVSISFAQQGRNSGSGDAPAAPDKSITGFTSEGAAHEFELEQQFDSKLKKDNLQQWMKRLSSRPHHVGSPAGKENAEFLASLFKSWGYDAKIETFYPLFPTPKIRVLEMTAPERYVAKLAEPAIAEDPTSADTREGLPVYNAYSIDGDVTGQLVYVNYGAPEDYDTLAEHGISVKGKIVIARYGMTWRGIKPKVAAEHGAIGCIIYSDPHDDGYFQGDVFPKGAWRPAWSAQRGSVDDIPLYPGDPLTPDRPATKDAQRPASYTSVETLTKIPVLPISYSDALPLLKALGGQVAPERWRGALPITYHIGPGPASVHLKLAFDWQLVPAYDVIARLPGSEFPDEWIIRGNHHDGWVFGATDPCSALVAMLEEARVVGELAKTGWRPKRTLIYASWDGEEPGLLGSTEWVEAHAEELRQHAAVYINSDVTGRGILGISGSHTLQHLMNQIARDIPDPIAGVSVLERYRAKQILTGTSDERRFAREGNDFTLNAMGSGSDYTPFIQHLGVASLDLRFTSDSTATGTYHSNYDSYEHFTKFEDPGFEYTLATAKLGGRTMLRLANSDVLPLRFQGINRAISSYVSDLVHLADTMRLDTRENDEYRAKHIYRLASDIPDSYVAPPAKPAVPFLNFAPLMNAVSRLHQSSERYSDGQAVLRGKNAAMPAAAAHSLDEILMHTERVLTNPAGLPRRPWYKHEIYAPGFYTGYGVKTIPAVREAIEQRNWSEAEQQIPIAAAAINALADEITKAAGVLENAAGQ